MADDDDIRQQVIDLMDGHPELAGLRPVFLVLANAVDRSNRERRMERVEQRKEYVRLQGVQVTILLMILGLVGLLVKAI